MAQVDSNIALSIKPAQIESPLTFSARAAELQGAQQTQFMNMLKMKEYADESRIKNNMTKWLSGKPDLDDDKNINYLATQFGTQGLALAKQIDERRKARGEADYRTAQIDDLKSQGLTRGYNLGKTQNEDAIKTISGFTNRQQALDLLYQSEANGTIPRAAAEAIRSTIPDNEEEFPAFKQSLIDRLASPDERIRQSNRVEDRAAPKWELKKVGAREMLVDTNPYSKTVGQMKPGVEALVDTTPKPEKIEQNGRISFIDMNPNSPTYGQPTGAMQEIVDTAPKWTARDIGGSITYVDENQNSSTFGQQKEGATLTKTAAPAAPNDLIEQYLYAKKNNGFTGTLLDFKKQVAMAGRNVTNNPAPVQTVTVMRPDGNPELRDARTGRRITDDQGKPLVPFDASNKPLSPVEQQKLRKDQAADNSKIVAAKDMADDVEKNADALLGNEKKKIRRHPGYGGITGYNALLPSLPGGDARGAQQLLDNIKGKVTVLGKNLASQEGKIGPMAVQEWKIVADALERIDPAAPNFPDQLRSIVAQARRLETNLKARNAELYPPAPSSNKPPPPPGFEPEKK